MKGFIILLLFVTGLAPLCAHAQFNQVNFYPPEAASLMRKIDYPVSHLTGMPDIKIPLHAIKAGALSLPIDLSFHIDNYAKANQMPGPAGAGWSLSTELQVSRTINGQDDLRGNGYCYTNTVLSDYTGAFTSRTRQQMKMLVDGIVDEEPDKFFYQLLGKSGSFYFQKQSNGSFVPVPVPFNGVKISFNFTTGAFTIVDTDGTTYLFSTSKIDWSSNLNNTNPQLLSWKCEEIRKLTNVTNRESLNKNDEYAKGEGADMKTFVLERFKIEADALLNVIDADKELKADGGNFKPLVDDYKGDYEKVLKGEMTREALINKIAEQEIKNVRNYDVIREYKLDFGGLQTQGKKLREKEREKKRKKEIEQKTLPIQE